MVTDEQSPIQPKEGQIYFNTDLWAYEMFINGEWRIVLEGEFEWSVGDFDE